MGEIMKKNSMLIIFTLFSMNCLAETSVTIKGKQAKELFDDLTGKNVTTDVSEKSIWRQGESVDCWIRPAKSKSLNAYGCSIHLDEEGKGTPRD